MKKTAIIGANGYIGTYILRKYREIYPDCIGTAFSNPRDNLLPFDLRFPKVEQLQLQKNDYEAVLIASAKPNIAWCEANPKESYELNVKGTLELVKQLEQQSLKTLFFSSDYVFNGQDGNYKDTHEPNPNTEYGRQKAEVEREIPNITKNYTILRLSKIYGTTCKDNTLIDSLSAALLQGKVQTVATDQFFSPTHVNDIVSMLLFLQEQDVKGLVNLCNTNKYSRYQIAKQLVEELGVSPLLIQGVPLHSIPGMTDRPLDTSLIHSAILQKMQPELISIQEAIKQISLCWKGSRN